MLVLYPDTNVLVHGKAFSSLPWAELGHARIDIVLCRQVIGELDKLKSRGGRTGKLAREWSSRIGTLMAATAMSEVLREEPHVTLRLDPGVPNFKPMREGLVLTDGDQAIINQILLARDGGVEAHLLTNDNIAAFTAGGYGVPVLRVPEHWLRAPEADELEKELRKRDAEITRLRAAEPKLRLQFVDNLGNRIERLEMTLKRYLPVPETEVKRLVEAVREAAPMSKVSTSPEDEAPVPVPGPFDMSRLGFGGIVSWPTQEDIEHYEAAYESWIGHVRAKFLRFHDEWNARRQWPVGALIGENEGTRAAEFALIELEAQGSFQLTGVTNEEEAAGRRKASDDWLSLPSRPTPPRPKTSYEQLIEKIPKVTLGDPIDLPFPHIGALTRKPRDEDRFYWKLDRNEPSTVLALSCQQWRHRRDPEAFGFLIHGSDEAKISGLITGRASATNLTEAVEVSLPVRVRFEDVETTELAWRLVDDLRRSSR